MTKGKRYRVLFKYMAGNGRSYTREMTALYLGPDDVLSEEQFSLRPIAGTTGIKKDNILKYEETTGPIHPPRAAVMDVGRS